MKIFLAGTDLLKAYPNELVKSKYQLASFYSIQDWQLPFLNGCKEWLLDSGAFSFMNGKKTDNFDDYLERYIEFINKNKVQYFFELDVDSIVGYGKVLEYRHRLEKGTSRQCIPVWHKTRGAKEWQNLCDEYSYVSIGGIVSKEILPEQYSAFPIMISEAHKRGAKVHGLGFTSTSYFKDIRFDTVDSTTWNVGGKFGNICVFSPETLMKQLIQKKNMRCAKQKELMLHNYNEWIKFQKWAERNL